MFNKINLYLEKVYKLSGYVAALFLILIAIFILLGVCSRIFGFYIRGLSEYSGYCMAASTFFALAYTFVEGGHIRITLFLERLNKKFRKLFEIWCLLVATFFSGYITFYFTKMIIISYKFKERSEGADEILIWIPQLPLGLGSVILFVCIFHHLIKCLYND
tara:strand:- start:1610 stop:2092 length:483 start_codon:yes stop_codon:yes gene_type:complete